MYNGRYYLQKKAIPKKGIAKQNCYRKIIAIIWLLS